MLLLPAAALQAATVAFQVESCCLLGVSERLDLDNLRLDAVCTGPRLPVDLAADAAPRVLTADKFQHFERAVHQD